MSGALAKHSLLTLAPDVYSQIFSYVKVWNGIRCVTAGRQLLEHRDGIAERWALMGFVMECRFQSRLLRRVEEGVWIIWRLAVYVARRTRRMLHEFTVFQEPEFDYLLTSPAQVFDEWFLASLRIGLFSSQPDIDEHLEILATHPMRGNWGSQ